MIGIIVQVTIGAVFAPIVFVGFISGLVLFFFHNGLMLAEKAADFIRGYK